uniref:Uncharacterized protein n=1 Tax=Sphaerodactylus townsendi TaxID=933632 RepID=A0ACB8E5D5_9SAUR
MELFAASCVAALRSLGGPRAATALSRSTVVLPRPPGHEDCPGFVQLCERIHMKTMPAAMFRLLTGQETPLYI